MLISKIVIACFFFVLVFVVYILIWKTIANFQIYQEDLTNFQLNENTIYVKNNAYFHKMSLFLI